MSKTGRKEREMNSNILRPLPVSSKQFTWVPEDRRFVAEESDLGTMGRVYADACDVGLTLISRTDGEEIVFVVNFTKMDAEGDIQYWDLIPADRKNRGWGVRVYND